MEGSMELVQSAQAFRATRRLVCVAQIRRTGQEFWRICGEV